ncbi:phage tail assembly chaperone [Sphingomonas sp. Tas61C01]|uniref:phage tail assembly chaperone n=1 Tax=Sphingomonas sp. Tas61C01 TaxID=3458297 RepID=UPI00403E89DE
MSATFAAAARRLAGSAGAVLGWTPDAFWRATPAELAAVAAAITGEAGGQAPPARATIARMREAYPDG